MILDRVKYDKFHRLKGDLLYVLLSMMLLKENRLKDSDDKKLGSPDVMYKIYKILW